MEGMVDLHCHLLPGMDDGPADLEESVEMARVILAEGIDTVVATPHYRFWRQENDLTEVLARLPELQERLEAEGLPLRVLPGGEVPVLPDLPRLLGEGRLPTVGNRGTWMLLEMPFDRTPRGLRDLVGEVRSMGVSVLVGHPERCGTFQRAPQRIDEEFPEDVPLQVTSHSLTGGFGPAARACGLALLQSGHPIVLASDAHGPYYRTPSLRQAVIVAAQVVGMDCARRMVTELPRALLDGREVRRREATEPPSRPQGSRLPWLSRGHR